MHILCCWFSCSDFGLVQQNIQKFEALQPLKMEVQYNSLKGGWDVLFKSSDVEAVKALLNLACMSRRQLSATETYEAMTVAEYVAKFILATAT